MQRVVVLSLLVAAASVVGACDSPPVPAEGEGEGEGEGENPAEGEGENPAEGEGENPAEGEGEDPAEGEGEGEGENPAEGEGEGENPAEGEGEGEPCLPGEGEGEGEGESNPGEGEGEGEGESCVPGETGAVQGVVVRALSAGTIGIGGAIVTSSLEEVVADSAGRFSIQAEPGERIAIDVRGPNGQVFSSSQAFVDVVAEGLSDLVVELLPGCSYTRAANAAVTIAPAACGLAEGVAGITLPANGVVDSAGAVVANVRVEMAPLPVVIGGRRAPDVMSAFPGDLAAIDDNGAPAFLESLGAVEVRLFNADTGARANLAAGATATITFPASPDALDDDVIRAWFYDTNAGAWIEEGVGSVGVDAASGTLVNRMQVSHFTWWNADRAVERSCVTGRLVATDGTVLSGATVRTTGIDYLGVTAATSGNDGRFRADARATSNIEVRGQVVIDGRVVASPAVNVVTAVASDTVCKDVGDIVLDVTATRGCIRGIVTDGSAGVANASVFAAFGAQMAAVTTDTNGAFCANVPTASVIDVSVLGRSGGLVHRAQRSGVSTSTGSVSCAAATACEDIGFIDAAPLTCIAGTISDENGVVAGATIVADGRKGFDVATSDVDGSYCAQVEQDDVIDILALQGPVGFQRTIERADIFTPSTAGSCSDAPQLCLQQNLVLGNLACLRGIAVDDDTNVPLAGVTISATDAEGGRTRSVKTANDGTFCVPAPADVVVEVVMTRFDASTRYHEEALVSTENSNTASCSTTGCTDLGTFFLSPEVVTGCITGRLLDGDAERPYNDTARVLLDGIPIAAILPRDDGRFCVDTGLAGDVYIEDPVERFDGCNDRQARLADVVNPIVSGGNCQNPSSCTDVGDLDFADFCAGS